MPTYRHLTLSIIAISTGLSVGTALTACSSANAPNATDTAASQPTLPSPMVVSPMSASHAVRSQKMADTTSININNSENYQPKQANPIHDTATDAIATFSIDTDTGSYANTRRFLNNGELPPSDAVRIEELINYFNYDFNHATRQGNAPFLVSTETVASPWQPTNHIIKIAIKADDPTADKYTKENTLPPSNLVFLVDVSGSMNDKDKLPLVKASLKMLAKQLREQDTISLITYAGNTDVVLPATRGNQTAKILSAIDKLSAEGSTNGEAAIKLAYQQARDNFKPNGINRILLMTDGDFNVGVSNVNDMLDIIRRERDDGISLSTFGFGMGNLNDYMTEQVADHGNGNYSYIDSLSEAKKALIDEMSATFNTVAKDVKVQVEFNPNTVKEWRLIGYENRVLATEDFNNDKVDAGDLGAGKAVVALFEVTPVGQQGLLDPKRYQPTKQDSQTAKNNDQEANDRKANELGYLKIRYKAPNTPSTPNTQKETQKSKLLEFPIINQITQPSRDLQFAMAVASTGELLTQSPYLHQSGKQWQFADSKKLAQNGLGDDPQGIRHEFIQLVDLADALNPSKR